MSSVKRVSMQKTKILSSTALLPPLSSQQQQPQQPNQPTSSFLNIPTLFQHVQNNLMCAGRHSYFIRVLTVVSYRNSAIVLGPEKMREIFAEIVGGVNRETIIDKLTGLFLVYESHAIQLAEGSEDCVGKFAKRFHRLSTEFFKDAKIVFVYNNVNQRLMSKMHYKFVPSKIVKESIDENASSSTTSKMSLTDTVEPIITMKDCDMYTFDLMKQINDLCLTISDDENKISGKVPVNFKLDEKHTEFIPQIGLIDCVLNIDLLQSLGEFSKMYGNIPDHYNYNDHVWPIPQDLTPNHVYDWNKYDVNLTFGQT